MARNAVIGVKILVDAASAAAGLEQSAARFGKFGAGLNQLVKPAAAVAGAVLAGAGAAVKAASDTQQAFGSLDAVFGKQSDTVKGWAKQAATSAGLSSAAYATSAAIIGAQLKNLGTPVDQIAGKTDGLIKLGADLAATYGGTTADAVSALSAALRGEADPAERYGLALNKTALNARMAQQGMGKLTGAAKKQAETATLLAMAHEQAGGAVGQFARESDSAAGAAQIAQAQWQNALSTLGTALLPVVTKAAEAFGKFAGWVEKNQSLVQTLAVIIGILAGAILVLAAAQAVVNAVMLASPVTWIILGIVALVVAIVVLWKKCDAFRTAVLAVFNAVKVAIAAIGQAAVAVAGWFASAWSAITAAVASAWSFIKTVAAGIGSVFSAAWNWIKSSAMSVWTAITGFIGGVVQSIIGFARAIAAPFVPVWNLIKLLGVAAFMVIRLAIQVFVAFVRANVAVVRAIFSAVWNFIKSAAAATFSAVMSFIRPIVAFVRGVTNAVRAAFSAAWNAIKAAASASMSYIASAINRLLAPVRAVASGIRSAFSAAWNFIKSAAGSAASAISSAVGRVLAPAQRAANGIKSAFSSAWNTLRSAAGAAVGWLSAPFHAVQGAISGAIGMVQSLIGWLSRIKVPSIHLPGTGKAAPAAAYAPTLTTAPRASLRTPSGRTAPATATSGVTVVVNGALDPESVARQIERILSGARQRRAGVTLNRRAAGTAATA